MIGCSRERHLSPARVQVGPVLHRPICVTDERTAPCILQLAPGPNSSGHGCLVPTLGESLCICVPTISLNRTLLGEASTGASKCSVNCPSLHNQLWYPSLLRALTDYPILLPPVQDILFGPEGQSHLLVLQGHIPPPQGIFGGSY